MQRSTVFLAMLLSMLGAYCSRESAVGPILWIGSVLPLRAGNTWNYEHSVDTNGVVVNSSLLCMSVGELDTFGTEAGYQIEHFVVGDGIEYLGPVLWANKADGLYDIVGRPFPLPPALHRALIFPTHVGDTLVFAGYLILTAALEEAVVVAAGIFNCVRYDVFMNNAMVAQVYAAPNVGIIKSWQLTFPRSRRVDKLVSYQLH
jgi:hypothetical protein